MTMDEAIRILDPETSFDALAEIEYYGGFNGDKAKVEAVNDACRLAVDALRAQQEAEKNELLTLDELRQMDGEPVWVVDGDGNEMWGLVDMTNDHPDVFDSQYGLWR